MTEWISVKDKLPKHEEFVVVCVAGICIPKTACFHLDNDVYYFLDTDYFYQYKNITHWMPLPIVPEIEL